MRRAALIPEHDEVDMERSARLESDVAHIRTDVAEMKTDIRDLRGKMDAGFAQARSETAAVRSKMEAGFTELRQSIAQLNVAMEKGFGQLNVAVEKIAAKSTVTSLETRVWGLTMLGAVLFAVARGLKWI